MTHRDRLTAWFGSGTRIQVLVRLSSLFHLYPKAYLMNSRMRYFVDKRG